MSNLTDEKYIKANGSNLNLGLNDKDLHKVLLACAYRAVVKANSCDENGFSLATIENIKDHYIEFYRIFADVDYDNYNIITEDLVRLLKILEQSFLVTNVIRAEEINNKIVKLSIWLIPS